MPAHDDSAAAPLEKEEMVSEVLRLKEAAAREPRYPAYWGDPPAGEASDKIPVSADQLPELWAEMQTRVSESLEDFEIEALDVVRNKELWRRYEAFKREQELKRQHQSFRCGCYTCTGQHHRHSGDIIDTIKAKFADEWRGVLLASCSLHSPQGRLVHHCHCSSLPASGRAERCWCYSTRKS